MKAAGAHAGHSIVPHDHSGQDREHRKAGEWCSGRHVCLTCATKDLPRGVWFDGPKCAAPKAKAA